MRLTSADLRDLEAADATGAGLLGRLVLPARASARRPVPAVLLIWADARIVDADEHEAAEESSRHAPPLVGPIRAALVERGVAVLTVHPTVAAGPGALAPSAVDAAAVALREHPFVDADAVSLVGLAGAGILAARAASTETARSCILVDPREPVPGWWTRTTATDAEVPSIVPTTTAPDARIARAATLGPPLDGVGIAATPVDVRAAAPNGPLNIASVVDIDVHDPGANGDGHANGDADHPSPVTGGDSAADDDASDRAADEPLRPSQRLAARPARRPAIVLAPASDRCPGTMMAVRLDAAVVDAGGRVRVERVARTAPGFAGLEDRQRVVDRILSIVAAGRRLGTPLTDEAGP